MGPHAYKQSTRFRIHNVPSHAVVEKLAFSVFRHASSETSAGGNVTAHLFGEEILRLPVINPHRHRAIIRTRLGIARNELSVSRNRLVGIVLVVIKPTRRN